LEEITRYRLYQNQLMEKLGLEWHIDAQESENL